MAENKLIMTVGADCHLEGASPSLISALKQQLTQSTGMQKNMAAGSEKSLNQSYIFLRNQIPGYVFQGDLQTMQSGS
jgi:hypothetical protein